MVTVVCFMVLVVTFCIGHQQSASSSTHPFIGCEKEVRLKWPNFCTLLWLLVVADGSGRVNSEGVAYYNRLIDALLARGTIQRLFQIPVSRCCQYTPASKSHSSKCFEYSCPGGCIILKEVLYISCKTTLIEVFRLPFHRHCQGWKYFWVWAPLRMYNPRGIVVYLYFLW